MLEYIKSRQISFKVSLPVSCADAFTWHEQKGAFQRLLPPWEKIKLTRYSGSITNGSQAELHCKLLGPIGFTWLLEHREYIHGKQFKDIQLRGPFSSYLHSHLFSELTNDSELEDRIEYRLPFPTLSHLFAPLLVENRLRRTFRYRHRITTQDLEIHAKYSDQKKLSFLVSGATGMIGKQVCAFLTTAGHKVTRIIRSPKQAELGDIVTDSSGDIKFNPDCVFDCVINLAGAGIADKRWSEERKKILIESRVNFTRKLVAALKILEVAPKTFISASGIGFYGDTINRCPDENGAIGSGFLAELSQQWEQAASEVQQTGTRLAILRLGVVLSAEAGALQKMLVPFYLGLGASLGSGKQKFGWVAIDDVLRAILFTAYENSLQGPINLVAPVDVSNFEFSRALADALSRPLLFSIPESILRLIFGEIADQALLISSNAQPKKLSEAGFEFLYTDPVKAIKDCLGCC